MNLRLSARPRAGFTLIELLVVVAIIAVLISILLPSLQIARKTARRVVCATNQKNFGTGLQTYASENDDWIIGAPNGSGMWAHETLERPDRLPTVVWDWASPMFKFLGRTDWPKDRIARMAETRKGVFKCPDNTEVMIPYAGVPSGHPNAIQDGPSYLTMWKMLCVGEKYRTAPNSNQGKVQQGTPYGVAWVVYGNTWETKPPDDYLPKLSRVGTNARKIFLMEGARYVLDSGGMDYDARLGFAWGAGSYTSSGPVFKDSREYGLPEGRIRSYRHMTNNVRGANALFFDGHAEYLTEKQSRYLPYTSPTGSLVTDVGQLHPDSQGLFTIRAPNNIVTD